MPLADTGRHAKVIACLIPGDGHVAFEGTIAVQHGTQRDPAVGYRHFLTGQIIQPGLGTRTADSRFSESGQIQQTDLVHDMLAFGGHISEGVVAAPAWGFAEIG